MKTGDSPRNPGGPGLNRWRGGARFDRRKPVSSVRGARCPPGAACADDSACRRRHRRRCGCRNHEPQQPGTSNRREPPRASVIGASVFGIKRHHHRPVDADNSPDIAASPVVVAAKAGTASCRSVAQSGPARPVPGDVASSRATQALPDDPHGLDPLPGSVLAVVRAEASAIAGGRRGRTESQSYRGQARNAETPSSCASRGVTADSREQLSEIRCCHRRRT